MRRKRQIKTPPEIPINFQKQIQTAKALWGDPCAEVGPATVADEIRAAEDEVRNELCKDRIGLNNLSVTINWMSELVDWENDVLRGDSGDN